MLGHSPSAFQPDDLVFHSARRVVQLRIGYKQPWHRIWAGENSFRIQSKDAA